MSSPHSFPCTRCNAHYLELEILHQYVLSWCQLHQCVFLSLIFLCYDCNCTFSGAEYCYPLHSCFCCYFLLLGLSHIQPIPQTRLMLLLIQETQFFAEPKNKRNVFNQCMNVILYFKVITFLSELKNQRYKISHIQ